MTVGSQASATLILEHRGSAVFGSFVSIIVGEGAELNLVSLQQWDRETVHAGQTGILIGADARVRTVCATFGGDLVRLVHNASFAGPKGTLEQYGCYFVDAGQHVEHRLFVDHNQPGTKSLIDFRGALQGRGAHAVWVGDVLIRPNATGIDTHESNRNLLLTDGCRVDSVPNLEIGTGDIAGAGHSTSSGRFDEEQLFYLQSRGLPEDEARRLIVQGFFLDIIRRIGVRDIEESLIAVVEKELAVHDGTTGGTA